MRRRHEEARRAFPKACAACDTLRIPDEVLDRAMDLFCSVVEHVGQEGHTVRRCRTEAVRQRVFVACVYALCEAVPLKAILRRTGLTLPDITKGRRIIGKLWPRRRLGRPRGMVSFVVDSVVEEPKALAADDLKALAGDLAEGILDNLGCQPVSAAAVAVVMVLGAWPPPRVHGLVGPDALGRIREICDVSSATLERLQREVAEHDALARWWWARRGVRPCVHAG